MRKLHALFLLLLFFQMAFAQKRTLTGKVETADGSPIESVTVKIKGKNVQTKTDASGMYSINIESSSDILTFTSVGYTVQELPVTDNNTLHVVLQEADSQLDEVVVIGYGTVKRKDLTGAVSSVDAKTIAAAPVSSALEALAGRVSGLSIMTTEGSPEAEMTVRVRGGGSITQDNSPLYIVDGFPVSSIADIAPNDIETIDVLKDASSTAIYGSRGANGVIIVTTKSGKAGKTNISFNAFTGVKRLADKLTVLQPYDYALLQYERALLKKDTINYTKYFGEFQDIDLYQGVVGNDWQDIVFGNTGTTYNQNLSVSGGTEKTKFNVSHNMVKDKAIMALSRYERQNLNFKLNHKIFDKLTLDLGFRFADTKINGAGANEVNEKSSADSRLKHAVIYPSIPLPGLTIRDENTDEDDSGFSLYNPLVSLSDNDQLVTRRQYNLNAALNYQITDNLRFRTDIGYDDYKNYQDRFYGVTTYYATNISDAQYQGNPVLGTTNTTKSTLRNTNTLNFDFKNILAKDHSLNLLGGHEYLVTKENVFSKENVGFPTTFTFEDARKLSGQGVAYASNTFYSPDDILLSFFSRANYGYKGKYLFNIAFRADGSSKFSTGNKWGYFPSMGAAWRISDEGFMTSTKGWLDDLKLRFSYGESGNNRIPAGQILQEYAVSNQNIYVNGETSLWAPSKTMANPDLRWETTVTRNLGLDMALFKNRLNFTAEIYQNTTKDLLILFPVAGTGYDNQYRNLGDTENKGFEVSVNYNAIRKKNFDLMINANLSINRNKIKSLGGLDAINGSTVTTGWASTEINQDYQAALGQALGSMYGYQNAGRYEVSDFQGYINNAWVLKEGVADASGVIGTLRPGSLKLKDLNNDGVINADDDRTIIGNATPKHTGGFSLVSRIYNFDIAAYFTWSFGNDIYNANKIEYTTTSRYANRNMTSEMESGKRWTNLRANGTISNDPDELASMNANTTMWSPVMDRFVFSDWAVEDGSFLRLTTATIGYTLPQSISKRAKMERLRFYVSGYNLLKFTNYSGFDPEVSTRRKTPLTPGVDYSAYPKSRSFVFGVNVGF
ncbi:SusC/RagA family TonB-linked outer membrane protein [Sphingobacterium sp. LRF_L2]|uniref:SusC/RagA family TonB-linked outer membrane protein n=1 Tax=Sphingobacterium sp. LRF_L2 TaxID=3369421 RepID=UPI003F6473BF